MDRNFIKILIENGTTFEEMARQDALVLLNNQITEVYIKNGLHRQMTEDKFNEEIKFAAVMLYEDVMNDGYYKKLRDQEVHYIFSEGMKGRLGTDKDIVITYKSLLRWIEGYIVHAERKEAIRLIQEERRPKPLQLPHHEKTDDEMLDTIKGDLAEYAEYRRQLQERLNKSKEKRIGGIQSVGEIIGPPPSLNDWGGWRRAWLVKNGYAKEGEKYVDVLLRAIANGNTLKSVV